MEKRRAPRTKRSIAALLLAAMIVSGACGGGNSPTEPQMPTVVPTATVLFTYSAPTAIDPAVDFAVCTPNQVNFTTHLHFIWNFWDDRRFMRVAGSDSFEYTAEVPVNQNHQIALHDPNSCLLGDVYFAPATLSANGVLLTRVVNVLEGTGLAFRVDADGTVTP